MLLAAQALVLPLLLGEGLGGGGDGRLSFERAFLVVRWLAGLGVAVLELSLVVGLVDFGLFVEDKHHS